MDSLDNSQLTELDVKRIEEYLQQMKALEDEQPPMFENEETDTETSEAFNAWLDRSTELTARYHDVVFKALKEIIRDMNEDERAEGIAVRKVLEASLRGRIPDINAEQLEKFLQPVDKVNGSIWHLELNKEEKGREEKGEPLSILARGFNVTPKGFKEDMVVTCAVNYEGLAPEIKEKLTAYDRRVHNAVLSLYVQAQAKNNGNGTVVMTVAQILKAMGSTTRATTSQLDKVNKSLTKMGGIRVYLNNEDESKRTKYSLFIRDEPLLSFGRISAFSKDGKLIDGAIRIDRIPFLGEWALDRQQYTTVLPELLNTPLSLTDANIQLEDYLIGEISKIKRGTRNSPKMLYKTIFERTNNNTKMQRKRAREKVKGILDFYKSEGYIAGYKSDKDGVTIFTSSK